MMSSQPACLSGANTERPSFEVLPSGCTGTSTFDQTDNKSVVADTLSFVAADEVIIICVFTLWVIMPFLPGIHCPSHVCCVDSADIKDVKENTEL